MKLLRSLFQFYVDASIHVALAVLALALVTLRELTILYDWTLVGAVFFGTITGYNFVKYARIAGLYHRSLAKSLRSIQLFSFLSFALMLYCAWHLPWKIIGLAGVFGLLTGLYVLPVFLNRSLRNLAGLKLIVVSMVWAGVTVLVPAANMEGSFSSDVWILFIQRFLLILVLTLPFEIRDLPYDLPKLHTLPQVVGIRNTKWLGSILLVICAILEGFKDELCINHAFSLQLTLIVSAILLWMSSKKQSRYFSSFWVESIPILYLIVFLFLDYYFATSC